MKSPHPRVVTSPWIRTVAGFNRTLVVLSVCCSAIISATTLARAQKKARRVQNSEIEIVSPTATAKQELVALGGSVKIVYKVNDEDIDSIRFKVEAPPYDAASGSVDFKREASHTFTAKLFKGKNEIHLFGFKGSDAVKNASAGLIVLCNDECNASSQTKEGEGGSGPQMPDTSGSNVTIKNPTGDVKDIVKDGLVDSLIVVKGGVKKVSIAVYDNQSNRVDHYESVAVTSVDDKTSIASLKLKVVQGANQIRVFDSDHPDDKANEALAVVTCSGDKCGKFDAASAAEGPRLEQKGSVKITSLKPLNYVDAKEAKINIIVEKKTPPATDVQSVKITVTNKEKDIPQADNPHAIAATDLSKPLEYAVKIAKGVNKVTVFDLNNKDNEVDHVDINCEGKCGSDADTKDIAIVQPKTAEGETSVNVTDKSALDAYVTVAKGSSIRSIQYDVINEGKPVFTSPSISVNPSDKDALVQMTLKFIKGSNTIRIYDADHPGSNNDASIVIKCTGDNCATDLNVATIVTNSQNTRIIVGLEQAGASSAKSETKPFLDFFFTTPILFDSAKSRGLASTTELDNKGQPVPGKGKPNVVWIRRSILPNGDDLIATTAFDSNGKVVFEDGKPKIVWIRKSVLGASDETRVPRAGFWGAVRLASTPEQLTTTGILPTNLANLVGSTGATTNLVQSFDFLAGLEGRVFTANGSFLSLIPGIRQKTRFYVAGGFGAISPLDATQENPKFFAIPAKTSSQRALFEQRYGKPPDTATQIALVPLERDRFFRQWYLGIRLKTFYCDRDSEGDPDCHQFRNAFPAIVDFMIGQNQSVTGGSFKRTSVDAAGNVTTKRAFVFRVDAFYPLPFREASFIYFYGTAMMKIGGNQKIDNFLVLDPATSSPSINDSTVYVPPVDFLRSLQSNRDYYKIGVGINLTDFFNRNKPKP